MSDSEDEFIDIEKGLQQDQNNIISQDNTTIRRNTWKQSIIDTLESLPFLILIVLILYILSMLTLLYIQTMVNILF